MPAITAGIFLFAIVGVPANISKSDLREAFKFRRPVSGRCKRQTPIIKERKYLCFHAKSFPLRPRRYPH
jgi:hypothetical protein